MKNDKEKDYTRKTELCMIMAMSNLEPAHALLILKIAINNLYKLGCYLYASFVANKYLQIYENFENPAKKTNVAKMKKILKSCSSKGTNKINLDLSQKSINDETWF